MKDKDLLIELYNEMKNEYQEYLRYFHTIRKLNGIIEGNKEIIDLNSSDLKLFDDDCKNIIENIKYISLFQLGEYSKEETNNSLVFIKEQLIKKIKKDISYYDKLYKNFLPEAICIDEFTYKKKTFAFNICDAKTGKTVIFIHNALLYHTFPLKSIPFPQNAPKKA